METQLRRPTPVTARDNQGNYSFGRYTSPIEKVNLRNADFGVFPRLTEKLKWKGRSLRLKEWHYVSFNGQDYFLGMALIQLGIVSQVFLYIVDKKAGSRKEFSLRKFGSSVLQMAPSSVYGKSLWLSGKGKNRVFFSINTSKDFEKSKGLFSNIQFEFFADSGQNFVTGQFKVIGNDESLGLLYQLAENRGAYTHKDAGCRCSGEVKWGDEKLVFTNDTSFAVWDWTKSFAKRETKWLWASFSCTLGTGEVLGFNASKDVYDDKLGRSMENVIWVNGRMYFLEGIFFKVPENPEKDPWRLEGRVDGKYCIDLEFYPLGVRKEEGNYGLVKSYFIQPYGFFKGTININHSKYKVSNAFGVMEKHYSLW